MRIASRLLLAFFSLTAFVSCGVSEPTTDDAQKAINEYYTGRGESKADVTIVRFGERGRGDFSAPGSQDAYWPVEFKRKRGGKQDVGPIQFSASSNQQAVALIYKNKMGYWKVGRIEP